MFKQKITPNPNVIYSHYDNSTNKSYMVNCWPGWCLEFVSKSFGAKPVYRTAIDSFNASPYKHTNYLFPPNCDVPVWFTLAYEPAGHVALRMSDGSVYSASASNSNTAVHHSSLDALIKYYSQANPLTFLGWTEDVEGTKVIEEKSMVEDTTYDYDILSQTFKNMTGRSLSKSEFKYQIGRSWQDVLVTFYSGNEAAVWFNKAANSNKEAKKLTNGLYIVG